MKSAALLPTSLSAILLLKAGLDLYDLLLQLPLHGSLHLRLLHEVVKGLQSSKQPVGQGDQRAQRFKTE